MAILIVSDYFDQSVQKVAEWLIFFKKEFIITNTIEFVEKFRFCKELNNKTETLSF